MTRKTPAVVALLALAVASYFVFSGEPTTRTTTSVQEAPVAATPPRPPRQSHEKAVPGENSAKPADDAVQNTNVAADPSKWPVRVTTNVPGAKVTTAFHRFCGDDPPAETKAADAKGFTGFATPEGGDPIANCTVTARADGFATARSDDAALGDVRLDLAPGVAVRGRVVDDSGRPVEAAEVTGCGERAVSAADGTFEAFAEKAGPVALRVEHVAFLPREAPIAAPADSVIVALERGLAVTGRVAFRDLRPVPGVEIRDGRGYGRATTDDEGRFTVTGLPPGPVELTCGITGEKRTVDAGTTGADFTVGVPVARVRLVDEKGRPFRFAVLLVRVVVNGGDVYSSVSLGSTESTRLVPGTPGARLLVAPSAEGFDDVVASETFDGEARLHDVTVVIRRGGPKGSIRLTVRGDGGAPPAAVWISLHNEAGSIPEAFSSKRIELGAQGTADVPGVTPGRYDADVAGGPSWSTDDYSISATGSVLVEGGRPSDLDVTLRVGGRVRVVVKDESGQAVAPADLQLLQEKDGRTARVGMFVSLLKDGGWTMPPDATPAVLQQATRPGRYVVEATGPAGDVVRQDVDVPRGETADVVLTVKTKR